MALNKVGSFPLLLQFPHHLTLLTHKHRMDDKEYNSTTEQLCQKYNQTCQSPDVSNCQECTLLSNKTLVELTVCSILLVFTRREPRLRLLCLTFRPFSAWAQLVNETYYCSSMYCPSTNCSQGEVCYSRYWIGLLLSWFYGCFLIVISPLSWHLCSSVLTYAECATECINPQYKNISSQLVNYVKQVIQTICLKGRGRFHSLFRLQDQELYATIKSLQPYLGCIIYDTYVTYTDYPVCVDFL